jgi:AraC family transcriptional regulator
MNTNLLTSATAAQPRLAPGLVPSLVPAGAGPLKGPARPREQPSLRSHHLPRMEQVLDHIETHLSQDLSLERLSDCAAISPFHFHRLFLAWTGETAKEFVRRRRLETAAGRLRHCPGAKIAAVSLNCGFASPEAFARAFREHFGMTPSRWRSGGWTDWRTPADHRRTATGYRVDLKHFEAKECLYMRERGDYGHCAEILHTRFVPWVDSMGLSDQPMLAIGLDDPTITLAAQCRMDACVELPPGWQDPGLRAMRKILPAHWAACLRYEGPSSEIGRGWNALLTEWLPASPFELAEGHFFQRCESGSPPPGSPIVRCDLCMPISAA